MNLQARASTTIIDHMGPVAFFCLILLPFLAGSATAESEVTLSRVEQFSTPVFPAAAFQKYSIIEQRGQGHQARISQSASAHYQQIAGIYQSGRHHQASISQHNVNAMAMIHQQGDSHVASIDQRDSSTDTFLGAGITQFGTRGHVEITQSSGDQSINVIQHAHSGSARPVIIDTYR